MASLVRIEPALFNADEAWFVFDDGRRYLRKREQPEPTPRGPMIIGDSISPVMSMADGQTYDSKSALFRTYRADGNPQGVSYECTGNEDTTKFERPKRDKAKSMEAIKRAMGDL
jgi:hypothetical protein